MRMGMLMHVIPMTMRMRMNDELSGAIAARAYFRLYYADTSVFSVIWVMIITSMLMVMHLFMGTKHFIPLLKKITTRIADAITRCCHKLISIFIGAAGGAL